MTKFLRSQTPVHRAQRLASNRKRKPNNLEALAYRPRKRIKKQESQQKISVTNEPHDIVLDDDIKDVLWQKVNQDLLNLSEREKITFIS